MKVLITFLLILCMHFMQAQKFPASSIPDELKADAHVVIRQRDQTFTITSRSRAIQHVHEVFTILNSKGDDYAEEVVDYDKLRRVTLFREQSMMLRGALSEN